MGSEKPTCRSLDHISSLNRLPYPTTAFPSHKNLLISPFYPFYGSQTSPCDSEQNQLGPLNYLYDSGVFNRDWMYDHIDDTASTKASRLSPSTSKMRDSVPLPESCTPINRPFSSNNRISSRERNIHDSYPWEPPHYERQRHDEPSLKNSTRSNTSTHDSRITPRAPISETGSSKYNTQWGTMMNMIRDTNLSFNEFQRSYSEKLNTAIARYPEQSKDWQLWYAEGVVWESHFSGKKFPGKEPFKLPIVTNVHSAPSEPYVTIESFMEAKALKGGFRKVFFKALNAKRHEVNEKQPTAERHKKAFWVDNEIWSQFWPNEPFPVKDPAGVDASSLIGRSRRGQQKSQLSQRNSRLKESPPIHALHDSGRYEPDYSVVPPKHTPGKTPIPSNPRAAPITPKKTSIGNPTSNSIVQSCAPAHILQGLLETQKNWQSKSLINGKIIMINRTPIICNDNPNLPREIFQILQSEDEQSGWEVQAGIGCCIQCTSVSTGDLLLWTTPLVPGISINEETGNLFLQGWVQRIITHGMVSMSSHWKDLQSHSNNQLVVQAISPDTGGEDSREEYKTTFRISDLDIMVIEETAKVEGNLRLVLDEDTGEVVTVAELVKRSKQRCFQGLSGIGIKRKADSVEKVINKRPCS